MSNELTAFLVQLQETLTQLKGEYVKIYRGGPESTKGKIVGVGQDFVTLQSKDGIVYYNIMHIKSVTQESKTPDSSSTEETDGITFYEATNFYDLLGTNFVGSNKEIKINLGGPESRKGYIVGVEQDYLILYSSEDGIVYYSLHHIKSISESSAKSSNESTEQTNEKETKNEASATKVEEPLVLPEYKTSSDFYSVFSDVSSQPTWVAVNRGGPEAIEGILVDTKNGFFTLINNTEVIRIHPSHIMSMNVGPKGSFKNSNKNESNDNSNSSEGNNDSSSKQSSTDTSDNSNNNNSKNSKDGNNNKNGNRNNRGNENVRENNRSNNGKSGQVGNNNPKEHKPIIIRRELLCNPFR